MATTQLIKTSTKIGVVSFKEINGGQRYVAKVLRSDLPHIRVKQDGNGGWEAQSLPATENRSGAEVLAVGRTAAKCYKNAVKTFWN